MTLKDDSGPAFPETHYYEERPDGLNSGMTVLDFFAASALTGLVMAGIPRDKQACEAYAEKAYMLAAAMVERREK